MCGVVGIYSLITAVLICLGYNKLYFELKLPNGSVGQLLDVMDYISNSFLMPFISLLTSILIGWVIGPDWIIGEVERNGEHFKRAGMYRFMIRYVVPVVMLVLFLVSTGFADFAPYGTFCSMTEPEGYPLEGEIHKFYPDRISGTCVGTMAFSPIEVRKDERIVKMAE